MIYLEAMSESLWEKWRRVDAGHCSACTQQHTDADELEAAARQVVERVKGLLNEKPAWVFAIDAVLRILREAGLVGREEGGAE